MHTVDQIAGPQRHRKRANTRIVVLSFALILAASLFIGLDREQRIIALPLYGIVTIVATLLAVLWKRDVAPPYFDLGVFCVAVTAVYLSYPLLMFLLAGLEWTPVSDGRLFFYQPTPIEFARVAWWGVLYLFSLALTYAAVRRHPAATFAIKLNAPKKCDVFAVLILFLSIHVYVQALQLFFGVDLNPSYGSEVTALASLPLLLQQVTGKVLGIGVVLQFGLILILVRWADIPICRWTLRIWAGAQILTTLLILGSRSAAAFFVLAWVLSHQRIRQPLRSLAVLFTGTGIIAGLLIYGFVRDIGEVQDTLRLAFSMTNEFQALYSTAYDLMSLRDTGGLPAIQLPFYFADILRPIPQQFLPFEKIDQSEWYLQLIGLSGTGQGYMFGVISEAAVGLGMIEMPIRGALLGLLLGGVHNWYARHATGFWPTLFYLWLCVVSYYTFRAGTFYLLVYVATFFVPAYVLVRIVSGTLKLVSLPRTKDAAVEEVF